jgi:hypothetical protein
MHNIHKWGYFAIGIIILFFVLVGWGVNVHFNKQRMAAINTTYQTPKASIAGEMQNKYGVLVDGFPKELLLIKGATVVRSAKQNVALNQTQYDAEFNTNKSVEDVYKIYKDYATKFGNVVTGEAPLKGGATINSYIRTGTLSVSIQRKDSLNVRYKISFITK